MLTKFKAKVDIALKSRRAAKSIAESVTPDNLQTPIGLRVKTYTQGNRVISIIQCEKRMETFLATLDDLLSCIQLAEKTLKVI